jgi:hypothetical protein
MPGYWNNYYYRDTEIVLISINATSKNEEKKFDPKGVVDIFWAQSDISLNDYPRILFSLNTALADHSAPRTKCRTTEPIFSQENTLIFLYF